MTFSKIVREIKKQNQLFKIVVVGLDNAGKTTIIHKLFNKPIDSISSTFGYKTFIHPYKDSNIQVLDIGGQSLFREYWDSYFDKADGIVFVYDVSERKEQSILSNKHLLDIINTTDTPILVFGNKVDLIYEEPYNEGDSRVRHLRCSGLNGTNLEVGMDWLVNVKGG